MLSKYFLKEGRKKGGTGERRGKRRGREYEGAGEMEEKKYRLWSKPRGVCLALGYLLWFPAHNSALRTAQIIPWQRHAGP